jgi:DNA-binding transcriptional ArsR family regulator
MGKKQLEAALLEDSPIFLHPIRYRLVELLAEKPMHINAISIALGLERRLVAYHLATFEEHGFVTSKYEISEEHRSKGKAIRLYKATDKVVEVKAKRKKGL